MADTPFLLVLTGVPGTGKTTLAESVARETGAGIANWDWLMSAVRAYDDLWEAAGRDPDRRREIGWTLMERVAEYRLRLGQSAIFDCVARPRALDRWRPLAERYGARLVVVECVLPDVDVHRSRIDGRRRAIPGWDELDWAHVEGSLAAYEPLPGPKLVLDATRPYEENLALLRAGLQLT